MFLLVTGILYFAGKDLLFPSKTELSKRSIALQHTPADVPGSDDGAASPLTATSGQRHTASIAGHHSGQNSDDQSYKEINIGLIDPAVSRRDISEMLSQVVALPAEPPSIPLIADLRMPSPTATPAEENAVAQEAGKPGSANSMATVAIADRSTSFVSTPPASSANAENSKDITDGSARLARNTVSRNTLATTRSTVDPVTGKGSVDSSHKAARGSVVFTDEIADQQRINWLYDYAVYNMPAAAKRGRKYFQMYFSPTATYRHLSGGITSKSGSNSLNPKDYLEHSPAWGFEVGSAYMYRITRNLTIKAGLQFKYMRYSVKAFANKMQASTDIQTNYGHAVDTAERRIRNMALDPNMTQLRLTNDVYQLSAPIGFELRVMGNERLQLNVGASIQPSYLLNTNNYYLTADYENYIKGPSQFRRWNLTGGVEAFLSYKLHNNLRLQAGPEFRYQLLSSFYNSYPVQEHLKGYGFKIGIVKAIP